MFSDEVLLKVDSTVAKLDAWAKLLIVRWYLRSHTDISAEALNAALYEFKEAYEPDA
jgi:hypothetical protein